MLKFLSGSILNENDEPVQAVAFFMNHTPVAHADVAKSLEMTVEHAGFCDVTESKFLHFYGKSISLNKGIEGLDVLALNEFVKNNKLILDSFNYWEKDRPFYLVMPEGEHPEFSLGIDTSETKIFSEFVKEVVESFNEHFSA